MQLNSTNRTNLLGVQMVYRGIVQDLGIIAAAGDVYSVVLGFPSSFQWHCRVSLTLRQSGQKQTTQNNTIQYKTKHKQYMFC